MADTPTPAPQAAPTDAPPQVNAPAAPAAPAPPTPNTGSTPDATMAQIAPFVANANAGNQKIAQLVKEGSAPPKPVPHARLLAIVNGIATGLSAFGDSIATHGQEGGAKEVTQIRGEEQAQRIAAQQAATAQRNAQIQQQQTVVDTNGKMAQNLFLLATMPDELKESHFKAQSAEQQIQTGAVALQDARHESMAKWGVDPLPSPTAGQLQNVEGASKMTQQLIDFASDPRVMGQGDQKDPALDSAVSDAKARLAEAQKNNDPDGVVMAMGGLRRAIDFHNQAVAAGTKQQEQIEKAPFGDAKAAALNAGLLKLYQVSNPAATSLPQGLAVSAQSTPADYQRIEGLVQHTEAAESTQATRNLGDEIKKQNMALLYGPSGIDPAATGKDYIDKLAFADPSRAAELKGYASGKLELSPQASRTIQGQALLKDIIRAYPDYDPTKAPEYAKLRTNFGEGKIATGLNSYNTAIHHLGTMMDTINAANDIDLNNPLSPARQKLAEDQAFVSGELAKAISNGQMTEGEKKEMGGAINGTIAGVAGKGKFTTQIQEAIKLLNGKLGAYAHQWEVGVPKGVDPWPVLDDESKSIISKINGGTAPKGQVSLKAAMALPENAGKTEGQVREHIQSLNYQVVP